MEQLKSVAAYCAANIEDYELRVQLALNVMDRMRCPLWMADERLDNEIRDCIEEWCDDNEVSIDFFDDIDTEEIIFAEI